MLKDYNDIWIFGMKHQKIIVKCKCLFFRLRDVCRALREMQEIALTQREKLDVLLANEKEHRELVRISYSYEIGKPSFVIKILIFEMLFKAEQVQCEKVELQALRDYVERQKCRIMTCRMKLIHFNDEKFQKGD